MRPLREGEERIGFGTVGPGSRLGNGWFVTKVSPSRKQVTVFLRSTLDTGSRFAGKKYTFTWDGEGYKRQGSYLTRIREGYEDYAENPVSGVGIALGIAAVIGIGWLLLRKKDEPKPATTAPPVATTTPRNATTTPSLDFLPVTAASCTFTYEQFDAWAKNNGKQAFWIPSAAMPPNVDNLPGADPLNASQYVIATSEGALVWVYGAGGAPVVSPIVRDAVCKSLGFVNA